MLRLNITKAAISVLSVAALTACGNVQSGSEFGVGRPEDVVQAQLQNLYDLTWGSPRARQALEVIEYAKRQEGIATCLAASGLAHSPAPFVDGTAPKRPPLSWFDVLVPADEDRAAVEGLGPRPFVASEVTPTKKWPGRLPSPGELKNCEEQAGEIDAILAVDPELDTKLHGLVESEVKSLSEDLASSYPKCMEGAGYPVAEGRNELLVRLEGKRSAGPNVSGDEVRAAVADARCRREHHLQAMNELDTPLQQFEGDYAERLEALKTRPEELQTKARTAAGRIGLSVRWI